MNKNRRQRLARELKSMSDNPRFFSKDGFEWNGDKDLAVWTGSEEAWIDGQPLAQYYDYMHDYNEHPLFTKWLKLNKLWWDWYDPGTIHIYEE